MSKEQTCEQIFTALEDRLAAQEPKDTLKLSRDRWVVGFMLIGMAMTVPSILGAAATWLTWLTAAGLILEICGFGVLAYRQIRDVAPDFVEAKRKFASELDAHFLKREELLTWLRGLPQLERERRLAYVESRLDSMSLRYPIVFGAVDKLGFLPLLVGLFVQVQAIETISLMTGLFAFAIIALYGMALWMTRFRLQMLSYLRLLRAAADNTH